MYELIDYDEYFNRHQYVASYCVIKYNLNDLKDTSFSVEKAIILNISNINEGVYPLLVISGKFKNNFYYAHNSTVFSKEEEKEAIARMETLIKALTVGDIKAFKLLFYGDEFYEVSGQVK